MELTPPNLSTVDNHSHKATTSPASGALGNSHNTSPSLSGGLSPAPLFPRFCAYLIDAIIVSIIAAIPVAVASLLSIPIRSEGPSFLMSLAFLASFCLPYAYFTILHASKEQSTFGKRWLGMRIVTLQGETLSKTQAFMRVLLTFMLPIVAIIAILLSLGSMAFTYKDSMHESIGLAFILAIPVALWGPYLTIYFNPLKQTLFDLMIKTIVIKD
jgi:uncharacterized RDD family membrane protein YckC